MFKNISYFFFYFIFISILLTNGPDAFAQSNSDTDAPLPPIPKETFHKARVEKILDEGVKNAYGMTLPFQKLQLRMLDTDQNITIDHGTQYSIDKSQLLSEGDTIFISKTENAPTGTIYRVVDRYRLNKIVPILMMFFLGILILSRWKGAGSIAGMIISLAIIVKYIVPQILAGADPLFVSIVGCIMIMVSTLYLAHGFTRKTTVALISTCIVLIFIGLLAVSFVNLTHLTGLGSEEAMSLRLGPTANINFKGLLLGGILIGALGVLDDVTTGLAASVFELAKANPHYSFHQLFKSGLNIGIEHIASLVNTLVLAYAGAALPLFIFIVMNPNGYPLEVMLNDGLIIEEVVRTLAGSIGLVAAVPLTTAMACYFVKPPNRTHHKSLSI